MIKVFTFHSKDDHLSSSCSDTVKEELAIAGTFNPKLDVYTYKYIVEQVERLPCTGYDPENVNRFLFILYK